MPVRRRTRRWLGWVLGLLAALVLALVLGALGGVAWLRERPETLLPWLNRIPGLQLEGLSGGSRGQPWRISHLQWQSPSGGGQLTLQGLRLADCAIRWRPRPGAWLALRCAQAAADRVQWQSGPPSATAAQPPAELRLPVDLAVAQWALAELRIDQAPPITGLRGSLALGDEGGQQHRLRLDGLAVDVGTPERPMPLRLRGEARIATGAPLTLNANVQAEFSRPAPGAAPTPGQAGNAAGELWRADIQVTGRLTDLALAIRLDGTAPTPNARPPRLTAQLGVQPFAAWPLGQLRLQTESLDLQALLPQGPRTALSGQALLDTRGRDQPVQVQIDLRNALPGPWDAGQLPLRRIVLRGSGSLQHPERPELAHLAIEWADQAGPAGELTGSGAWQGDRLDLALRLNKLLPARLHRSAAPVQLSGPLRLQWQAGAGTAAGTGTAAPQLQLEGQIDGQALAGPALPLRLDFAANWQPGELRVARAQARAGSALAQMTGQAQWTGQSWSLTSRGQLQQFDPLPWWRGPPDGAWRRGPHRLQGDWALDLRGPMPMPTQAAWANRLDALHGRAELNLRDSILAGVPLAAQLKMRRERGQAELQAEATLAGNRMQARSTAAAPSWSAAGWQVAVEAPALAALAPLAGLIEPWAPGAAAYWPIDGTLRADAQWQPSPPRAWQSQGQAVVQRLRTAQLSLDKAQAQWQISSRPADPLRLDLNLSGLQQGERRLDQWSLQAQGTAAAHRVQLQAESPLRPPAWTEQLLGPAGTGSRLQWQADGSWSAGGATQAAGWRWQAGTLALGAREPGGNRAWLSAQGLAGRFDIGPNGAPQRLLLEPGRLRLADTTALRWQTLAWQAAQPGLAGALTVDAELERFDVAPLLARVQPELGWGGDLSLGGRIRLRSSDRLDADIVLERMGGDLHLSDEILGRQPLGLSELRLALSAHEGLWQFAQGLAGTQIGTLAGAQLVRTPPGRPWPQAGDALQGVLQARVGNLAAWGSWVPPGWRLAGELDVQGLIGGSLGAPELSGSMQGRRIALRHMLQGVDLSEGELAVALQGETMRIDTLRFKGGDGELRILGQASLGAKPALDLALEAERFKLLGRLDRRVVVSGNTRLRLERDALQAEGRLRVDEGLFDVSRSDAPGLDDDVVIHRQREPASPRAADGRATDPTPAAVRRAQVALDIDLGERLRLRGRGVDTGLRGQLRLTMPEGRPTLSGRVRTHQGRYAAYGQKLEIERGEFVFNGPIDNPRLDILALRPNLDVEVGVAITGPAIAPRVRLHSQPDMTDYEKLSWLMLGRSSDGLGNADTALLQRAALALISGDQGSSTDRLLDAIGLTDFSVRQSGNDSSRDTVISLGKQLSRRWYVGYERGVNATVGTWQLVYRIAQRFTLRAQSGSENAVDIIWSWRW